MILRRIIIPVVIIIFIILIIAYKKNEQQHIYIEHFEDRNNCAPNYTPVVNINYNKKLNNPLFGMSGKELQDIFDSIVKKNKSKYTPNNMIKIEKQQYDYYSGLTDLYIVNYDELVMYLNKIINIINNRINISDLNSGYFILNNYYLQSIYKNNNNDKRYVVIFEFYQESKLNMFSVLADIVVYVNNSENNDFKINRLILKSVSSKENLYLTKGYDGDSERVTIRNKYPEINVFDPQKYYMSSDTEDILINKDMNRTLLKSKSQKNLLFKCFYPDKKAFNNDQVNNRNICQSDTDGRGKKTKTGVWDRNCKNNEECPFYRSNKNYKNDFGGCINGTCQLPVNMVSVSPHFYDDTKKPMCYNCLGNNNNCCEEQKDKSKYPNLISPDYAFLGDQNIRLRQKKQLSNKGLYNKYLK
jgi:hypothetical protein